MGPFISNTVVFEIEKFATFLDESAFICLTGVQILLVAGGTIT